MSTTAPVPIFRACRCSNQVTVAAVPCSSSASLASSQTVGQPTGTPVAPGVPGGTIYGTQVDVEWMWNG